MQTGSKWTVWLRDAHTRKLDWGLIVSLLLLAISLLGFAYMFWTWWK